MTKTTEWQTRDGRQVIATMSVECSVYTDDSYLDGDLVSSTRKPRTNRQITITVAGKIFGRGEHLSTWMPKNSPIGYNRSLDKVAIPDNQTTIIEQAMIDLTLQAQASATDEYRTLETERLETIEYNKRRAAQNEKDAHELDRSRRANGMCPKCHSYCYGDCEAA